MALVVANDGLDFNSSASAGYGLALVAALAWAAYSLMSRYFGDTPTSSVVVFCIASAFLSFFAHLALEDTVWSIGLMAWTSIVCLGIGPIGLAFYIWDVGMKHGDIQFLGVASYAAPLISTFALIAVAIAPFTWSLLAASILIAVSAGIAARASFSNDLGHELQETDFHQLPTDGHFVRVADL